MEKVSVLLPNFNNALYLKEALDSVFNQTYQNFIIYFVDDCSTDNSVEIAESYKDDRLIIIKKEENSGIVDTMNVALDLIDTKYYIRMDGDDISHPKRFETLINFMDEHPDIGVCSSSIQIFGQSEETLNYQNDSEKLKAHLVFSHAIGHASSIFRSAAIKNNGIWYSNTFWRMEDYHLFYQLKDLVNTTSIPDVLYLYRKEDYNTNPEIEGKKVEVFRKFYRMILSDLGFEVTDKDVEIHLQFSLRAAPLFKYNDYLRHMNKIVSLNDKSNVYPSKQLHEIFQIFFIKLSYRLIDAKAMKFFDVLSMSKKDFNILRYYIKKKINIWKE